MIAGRIHKREKYNKHVNNGHYSHFSFYMEYQIYSRYDFQLIFGINI